MPTVKVFSIDTVSDAGVDITVETDLISGGEPLRYGLSLTKANYLEWKTTHPTGTPKDYIIELVKERYDDFSQMKNIANTLIGQVLTW